MRILTLATAAIAVLFAAKPADAQTSCYDAITNATTANYVLTTSGGDAINSPGCSNVCQIQVLFVATAAGSYDVALDAWGSGCLGTYSVPASLSCTGPITVGAPGVYGVNFTFATPIAGPLLGVTVNSNCTSFVPAYDNSAAIPAGSDTNWFGYDFNADGTINTCAPDNETATFNSAWTNANLLMKVTSCPSPSLAFHGPIAGLTQSVTVEKIDMPSRRIRGVMAVKVMDPKK